MLQQGFDICQKLLRDCCWEMEWKQAVQCEFQGNIKGMKPIQHLEDVLLEPIVRSGVLFFVQIVNNIGTKCFISAPFPERIGYSARGL